MFHNFRAAVVIIALAATAPAYVASAADVPLKSVVIDGSTVYSQAELFTAYRDQLGETVSRDGVRTIAAAVAVLYRDDGYARPGLKLDQTLAANGVLRLQVQEPYISRVIIEGEPGRHRDVLEHIAGNLYESRPLRRDAIPRAITEMRRVPGLTVKPTTRRDPELPNAYELLLDVDFAPFAGVVHVNNRGTDEIGPHFLFGQLAVNDLFGRNEKLGLVFSAAADTEEYLSGGLFYDTPLGDDERRGMLMVFRSKSAPNEAPVDLTDEYVRERVSLTVTQTFTGSGDRNYALTGGLEAQDLTVDRDGVDVRDDRLRILEAGLRMSWRAGLATQLSSAVELRKGLDGLGSGLRADDLPVDPRRVDFFVTHLRASSSTRFQTAWTLRFDAFGQYTTHVLPDSERFKIGGERLGRGFEVAEIAGDQGVGAKAVIRRDLPGGGAVGRLSVYGLYDIGAAWKEDLGGRESAATAALGFGLNGDRLSGYIEVAKPLTHADVEGKRSTAVFAEISFRF